MLYLIFFLDDDNKKEIKYNACCTTQFSQDQHFWLGASAGDAQDMSIQFHSTLVM